MKIDRLIGILSILLQEEKITAPELAKKFEVSRRTINRDIEDLCKAGIPIMTSQGAGGGISIMDGYKMDRTILTSRDMRMRWQDGVEGCDYRIKAEFNWISVIRLPDFVTKKDFDWAVETASAKKKMDCSGAEFLTVDEGLCVQIMHHGPFDDEPATVAIMDKYLEDHGYRNDFSQGRLHHEIYMSDVRKVAPEKWKTVIRHPICKIL